jgi:uncharacterized protein YjbJ (UPF0337 family)
MPALVNKEHVMAVNRDQVKGRVNAAQGTIKQAVGKLVGNQKLETKGRVQKVAGKTQAKFGDIKGVVKNAMNKVKS